MTSENLDLGTWDNASLQKKIGPKIEKSLTHPNNSSCLKLDDYRSWHFLQFSMKSWMIVDDNVIEGKGWVSLQISFCTENPNKTLPKTLTLFQASSFVRFPVVFRESWEPGTLGECSKSSIWPAFLANREGVCTKILFCPDILRGMMKTNPG